MKTTIWGFVLLFLLLTTENHSFGQENEFAPPRPRNNLYIGLMGDNASVVSLMYERLFQLSSQLILSAGAGFGLYQDILTPSMRYFTLPHHVTLNVGKERWFFEAGLGGTFVGIKDDNSDYDKYLVYPLVGFRIQPLRTRRVLFRFNLNYPLNKKENVLLPTIYGLSLGISWNDDQD